MLKQVKVTVNSSYPIILSYESLESQEQREIARKCEQRQQIYWRAIETNVKYICRLREGRRLVKTVSDTSHPLHSEFQCFLQTGAIHLRPTRD